MRLDGNATARALGGDMTFIRLFLGHALEQNEKLRDHLIDQLFNSSEKRLARILLTLANTGSGEASRSIAIPSRKRPSLRWSALRGRASIGSCGYVDYNGMIRVHETLLNVILEDPTN